MYEMGFGWGGGGGEVIEQKICVLIFSTLLSENTSLSEKNSARYYKNCQ